MEVKIIRISTLLEKRNWSAKTVVHITVLTNLMFWLFKPI